MLFGTDVGYMHDYDPTDEYVLMAKAGMSPAQILESLTTAPAARWKEEKRSRPGRERLCRRPGDAGRGSLRRRQEFRQRAMRAPRGRSRSIRGQGHSHASPGRQERSWIPRRRSTPRARTPSPLLTWPGAISPPPTCGASSRIGVLLKAPSSPCSSSSNPATSSTTVAMAKTSWRTGRVAARVRPASGRNSSVRGWAPKPSRPPWTRPRTTARTS